MTKEGKKEERPPENIHLVVKSINGKYESFKRKTSKDPQSEPKAKSFSYFLVLIQIFVCLTYTFFAIRYRQKLIFWIAVIMTAFIGVRIICLLGFYIRRIYSFYNLRNNPQGDHIWVFVPTYGEDVAALRRTIDSVLSSDYGGPLSILIVIDGNKGNSFQSALEVLDKKALELKMNNIPTEKHGRMLHMGFAGPNNNIPYCIWLKEENRGKRDSQWLLAEILRYSPKHSPKYVMMVDSDTSFERNAISILHSNLSNNENAAAVCGRLKLSNAAASWTSLFSRHSIYAWSTLFIVQLQNYEYHFNQVLGKQSEAALGCVTCLPGAFSLIKTQEYIDIEAVVGKPITDRSQLLQSGRLLTVPERYHFDLDNMGTMTRTFVERLDTKSWLLYDFFSKETDGIFERNLYDLGEDRTLTVRLIQKGKQTLYDPSAVAYTECMETVATLMKQRRRWNNSSFINMLFMFFSLKTWKQIKTFPINFITIVELIFSYILPANVSLLLWYQWDLMFQYLHQWTGIQIYSSYVVVGFILLTFFVTIISDVDKSEAFYVYSTLIASVLMVASTIFFLKDGIIPAIKDSISDFREQWYILITILGFPVLHLLACFLPLLDFRDIKRNLGDLLFIFTGVFYYFLIPIVAFTIPIYSFMNLHVFNWGTR